MKTLILNILLLSLTLTVCGQEALKTKNKTSSNALAKTTNMAVVRDTMMTISLSKITSPLSIQTFIKEIASSCLNISYSITAKVAGTPKIIHCMQSQFPAEAQAMINSFKAGDKFIIDDIKSYCYHPTKRVYKITIGQ